MMWHSGYDVVGKLPIFSEDEIRNEPMLFACSMTYALNNGGPITKSFIDKLPEEFFNRNVIIDSRVSMLMEGWYPAIPGFHIDDIPRSRVDGQPNYLDPEYKSKHVAAVVGDCSLTSFIVGTSIEVSDVDVGDKVYAKWDKEIKDQLQNGTIEERTIGERELVQFGYGDLHRANPATKRGWRLFIRASKDTGRLVFNEIRNQVQVYLPCVNAGW